MAKPNKHVLVTLTFTQEELESLGMAYCECGHTPNNHFDPPVSSGCSRAGCKCQEYIQAVPKRLAETRRTTYVLRTPTVEQLEKAAKRLRDVCCPVHGIGLCQTAGDTMACPRKDCGLEFQIDKSRPCVLCPRGSANGVFCPPCMDEIENYPQAWKEELKPLIEGKHRRKALKLVQEMSLRE